MKLRVVATILALQLLCAGVVSGQVLYGNLVGNVTDPQQAAVVGAVVKVTNPATGYTVEAKTDDRGAYEVRNLPPGVFDINITAAGFNSFEAKGIGIAANNIARVDAPLKVGAVSEVITVGAEVVRLQTDKSDLHTDIGTKELTQISVGGYRNYQSLMDLIPGTTPAAFQNASTDSPARALTTNVNGTTRNNNNTRIDGAANVFTWLPHHSFYVPPLESIETVNITTNNFDAEQGMSGGAAINVITKSGTNDFHGVAFLYHSNHKWGAKNLFFNPNTPAGPGIPQRIDNQGGGTFGGPIKKNKLFFFSSWERSTTAERGNGLLSVPTAQIRGGNFAGLATVYDPLTGTATGTGRTPFPDNLVPENRWSFASRTLQNMIPLPNTGTAQNNNYFASVPYYFRRDMIDAKVNYTPTSSMNIFGKYSIMDAPISSDAPLGEALGGYPGGAAGAAGIGTGFNTTHVFGAGLSYVISPTLLFDGNFGGTRMHHDTQGPDYGKNIGLDVLRIPGTNGSDIRQSGFPIFEISGYTSLGNTNNWSPVERNDRLYTYAANLNWTKGAHNIRFGLEFLQHQMNHWQPETGLGPRGGFRFVNGVTGLSGGAAANNLNAYAAFLLGMPGSMTKSIQFYDPMRTREFQQGYYIRDNWQATRNLSFNLGLRVEHFPIMHRGEFGIERYDPDTNKVLIGGRGNVPRNAGSSAIAMQLAPRIGMAYRWGDKTVFRAGFGITNDPYPLSRPMRSPFPAVLVFDYQPANAFLSARTLEQGLPAPILPDISSGIVDIPNTIGTRSLQAGELRRGYIESFNFTIQRELPGAFVLQTGYVGTRSIRQASNFQINPGLVPGAGAGGRPLFTRYGVNVDRDFFLPAGHQRYDSWQSNVSRRMADFFLTASYTWSKNITNLNGGNSDGGYRFYVPTQVSKNRTLTDFDRTHAFTAAATYQLPFGKGKRLATDGAAAAILGGWQINPYLTLYSGSPFSVGADGASLNAPNNTQLADQVTADVQRFGGVGLGAPFYDRAAFAAVTQPRFGNTSPNLLRGPNLRNLNLSVFRQFDITEAVNLQFRAEGLNVTNTPALNNPNATVTTPANFMQITAAGIGITPQRTLRFGLRLAF
jgi:hypothetical protein